MSTGLITQLEDRPALPALAEGMSDGLDLLQGYVQLPRIKIVQPTSRAPFKGVYAPGDLVAVPLMMMLGREFTFTPVFFYPEWVTWNPLDTKGQLPAIRDRSLDPSSDIAFKSRSEKTRNTEPCPEMPTGPNSKKLFLKHLEHLNFVLMIDPPCPLAGMPVTLGFSSGEHRSGSNFSTLIFARNPAGTPRGERIPIWAMRFSARVNDRENSKGTWYGVDISNPPLEDTLGPWVRDEQTVEAYAAQARICQEAHRNKTLVTQLDDEDIEASTVAGTAQEKRF